MLVVEIAFVRLKEKRKPVESNGGGVDLGGIAIHVI